MTTSPGSATTDHAVVGVELFFRFDDV